MRLSCFSVLFYVLFFSELLRVRLVDSWCLLVCRVS